MDRISAAGYVLNTAGNRVFTNENLATGVNGTDVDEVWLTGVQEELMAILAAAGTPPDATNNGLVLASLLKLFQAALGFAPVQQGGGANQGANKVYLGLDKMVGAHLRAMVDETDLGTMALFSDFPQSLGVSPIQVSPSSCRRCPAAP